VLCDRPDANKGSNGPGIDTVDGLLAGCDWFYVYDAIELLGDCLRAYGAGDCSACEREMNLSFKEEVIGWALHNAHPRPRSAATTAFAAGFAGRLTSS
jgi:hypothetical protein